MPGAYQLLPAPFLCLDIPTTTLLNNRPFLQHHSLSALHFPEKSRSNNLYPLQNAKTLTAMALKPAKVETRRAKGHLPEARRLRGRAKTWMGLGSSPGWYSKTYIFKPTSPRASATRNRAPYPPPVLPYSPFASQHYYRTSHNLSILIERRNDDTKRDFLPSDCTQYK